MLSRVARQVLVACTVVVPVLLLGAGVSDGASAGFPDRAVRLIVGFGAGGSSDLSARQIGKYLEQALGVPMVIDNRPGASSRIALTEVFRAKTDGYTLTLADMPTMQTGEIVYNGAYDSDEFTFIGGHESRSHAIVVAAKSPFKSFERLVAESKKRDLLVGFSGFGSANHLQYQVLAAASGLKATLVPMESAAETDAAILGGNVDFGVEDISQAVIGDREGLTRALLVQLGKRSEKLPNVPTPVELGYGPHSYFESLRGIAGPPSLPGDVAKTLREAYRKAVTSDGYKKDAEARGVFPVYLTPDQLRDEVKKLKDLVRRNVELLKSTR